MHWPIRHKVRAGCAAPAGTDERAPRVRVQRLDEEELDGPAGSVLGQHASGNHARIVHHEAVARAQQARQVDERAVLGEIGAQGAGAIVEQK